MVILYGNISNLPPALKTVVTAAIPAPIIIPDFMAEGIRRIILVASLVVPRKPIVIQA